MADSAIASLPFINTFSAILLLHLDYTVWAHSCAECTANALFLVCHNCRIVSFLVDLVFCKRQNVLWTSVYTEATTFADVFIKCNFSHFFLLVKNPLLEIQRNHIRSGDTLLSRNRYNRDAAEPRKLFSITICFSYSLHCSFCT